MPLEFQGSSKPTIGVELELQLLNPQSYDLIPLAEDLLAVCKSIGDERVKCEVHQSMIEVDSEVSKDVKECRQYLKDRLLSVNEIAERVGVELAMTGTHPFQCWPERLISNSDRYRYLHEKYRWVFRRMNVYGMHVHIGVSSGERALAICRAMTKYLPHLLALSGNSPFWHGVDTGMQSSRISILDAFPFAGMPKRISSWKEFENYYDTLYKVGAIKTFKDFYWYIRPNLLYGTIEVRICDVMTTLDETMALTALIQCLAAEINEKLDAGIELEQSPELQWIAPENMLIAARDGLEGRIIVDLDGTRQQIAEEIFKLADALLPMAKKLNCEEELLYLHSMIKRGNGAQRQRKIFQETGSLREVVMQSRAEFLSCLDENCSVSSK